MDFDRGEDRQILFDTLARFLADRYPVSHRTVLAYAPPFHDPAKWAELADLGVVSALVPEDRGGYGGTGHDVATVFEALGGALCPEPVLAQLLGLRVLLATGAALGEILHGRERVALAIHEAEGGAGLDGIAATARRDGDGWRLSGRKPVVYGGQAATRLLVAARSEGGIGVFSVPAGAARVTPWGMIDGGGAADLVLEDAPADPLLLDGAAALDAAMDWGRVALCAEAVGAMDRVLAMTTDYLRTRRQFGQPIGSFQALAHRLVDLAIEVEQARSITILAADGLGGSGRARQVAMAKHLVGRVARQLAEEAIQLHGGIAMTWEAEISHYAKRLVMIDHQLGDSDDHLWRLASGLRPPGAKG